MEIVIGWIIAVAFMALFNTKETNRLFQRFSGVVFGRHFTNTATLFDNSYVSSQQYYCQVFGKIPTICFMKNIDTAKSIDYINREYAGGIISVYQSGFYEHSVKNIETRVTLIRLVGKIVVEVGKDYVEILYDYQSPERAKSMIKELMGYISQEKSKDNEICIITRGYDGLELKPLPIKSVDLDISLYYNDDFSLVHEVIVKRLAQQNDKGIVLLHGLPGTGKTTYLRYLIGQLKKKVLFLSPAIAENLMSPEMMNLLIDYPNAVLVIEDAENIIMDRKLTNGSAVSNLLNISDGLLSDCLNVQIICTFNSPLTMVDTALLRKGRLIASYAFNQLTVEKAQQLAAHLKLGKDIQSPMSLSEIVHASESGYAVRKIEVAGFRRKEEQYN